MCRFSRLSCCGTDAHLLSPPVLCGLLQERARQVREIHSCQPLLGVNLSPEFVNLYFPYAGWGLLFFAGGGGILNSSWHVWRWKQEAMLCEIHMCDFKSHFQQDFFSLVHLASQCAFGDGVCRLLVWQCFNLFAQFKTTTKSHENYVFLYPFSKMAISLHNEKTVFYTGKLYGLTGMGIQSSLKEEQG